ncbi:DUF4259 domain-containing protein [Streptomyces sp. NPDC058682]|uniref:DUF4259 domain-containing protein n=1 Tax=Streptomyces sp. NPDC058682 TaxID=3346596 RepID=UPI00364855D0
MISNCQEKMMGTWGTGPFDSDIAGDFTDRIRGLPPQRLVSALEEALRRVADSGPRVDGGDGAEAVAAAALVAAQIPGSDLVIDPDDRPDEPLPGVPDALCGLASEALHRVLEEGSELASGWVDTNEADQWSRGVRSILRALG